MQLKYKALAIVVLVTAITSTISGWSSYSTNAGVIDSAKQKELRATAILIQNNISDQESKAAARASMVVNLPSIQEAFRKSDRE